MAVVVFCLFEAEAFFRHAMWFSLKSTIIAYHDQLASVFYSRLCESFLLKLECIPRAVHAVQLHSLKTVNFVKYCPEFMTNLFPYNHFDTFPIAILIEVHIY